MLIRRLGRATTLLDADGQPCSTVHQLRHIWGTEIVEEHSPLHVVQKALGHIDPHSIPGECRPERPERPARASTVPALPCYAAQSIEVVHAYTTCFFHAGRI